MEPGIGPDSGHNMITEPWRDVFPPAAGLFVATRGGIKVIPEMKGHVFSDPTLQRLEFYTSLPEQSLAFEADTMNTFLAALLRLSGSMKEYAAKLNPAVPEWQTQVDDLITAVGDASQKAYALNKAINIRLRADGTLGGNGKGDPPKAGEGESDKATGSTDGASEG